MNVLIDTNVLLRMADRTHPQNQLALDSVAALGRQPVVNLSVVPQVIYEFWAVCTRPLTANGLGRSASEAELEVAGVRRRFAWLADQPDVFDVWFNLVTRTPVHGKPSHDARLVAAMLVHGVDHLLTFNDADFRRFAGITVLSPAGVAGTP
jgi:predicted nucleic acid-binding protein